MTTSGAGDKRVQDFRSPMGKAAVSRARGRPEIDMLKTDVNDEHAAFTPAADEMSLQPIARPVFLGWEKLRFAYIVMMAVWCRFLFMTFDPGGDEDRFWMRCIFGGILANLCYFAGPLFETYVTWLSGRRHAWLRPLLFILGTIFTMLLAFATLVDFGD